MTQFVWATDRHVKDVLSLWKQGFAEDAEEDILTFWRTVRGEGRCLLLQEDGEALSMAFLIPAQMDTHTVWYVYAAVTATAHRGRGLFPKLLEEIVCRARQEGVYGLFLRPGDESLFAYYARFGFVPAFSVTRFKCKAKLLHSFDKRLTWQPVTANFALCRRYWLTRCGIPHIVWSEGVTAYAVTLLERGGMVVSSKGLAMYRRAGDTLIVTELLCQPGDRDEVLASLARCFACRKMSVTMPTAAGENEQAYGMFRLIETKTAQEGGWYMGFSLE